MEWLKEVSVTIRERKRERESEGKKMPLLFPGAFFFAWVDFGFAPAAAAQTEIYIQTA
jgi:hypothetical protein